MSRSCPSIFTTVVHAPTSLASMFPGVRRLAAFQLGRCFALGGDVAKARQWLGAIKRRGSGLDKRSATTKRTGTG
jgi:hypothetical protein